MQREDARTAVNKILTTIWSRRLRGPFWKAFTFGDAFAQSALQPILTKDVDSIGPLRSTTHFLSKMPIGQPAFSASCEICRVWSPES
jgi:hypothetical protein